MQKRRYKINNLYDKTPGEIRYTRDIPEHNKGNLQKTNNHCAPSKEKFKVIPLKSATSQGCSNFP